MRDVFVTFLLSLHANHHAHPQHSVLRYRCSLEHLTVSPLHRLAVDLNRLVPRPHVVDELLVLRLGGVELGELVRVDIRRDVESRERLLAADDKGTPHDRVVGDAVNRSGAEQVLARALKTGEEAADEVGRHEGHGQLVVVLVVDAVNAVLVELAVLPEPGGVLAGVDVTF